MGKSFVGLNVQKALPKEEFSKKWSIMHQIKNTNQSIKQEILIQESNLNFELHMISRFLLEFRARSRI